MAFHDVMQGYHIENVAVVAEVPDNEDGADTIHQVGHDQVVEAHETDMSQSVAVDVVDADPNEMRRCHYLILDGDPIANDSVVVVHAQEEVVLESCNIAVKRDNILYKRFRHVFRTIIFRTLYRQNIMIILS